MRLVWGLGLAAAACSASSTGKPAPGPWDVLLAWFTPFALIAVAALLARANGWRNVAIGLWISVGLGMLSTGFVASLAFQ